MAAERHTVVPHLQCVSPPPRSLALPGWHYSLHLYLDYGFPLSLLPTVVSALHASFPFFRLTHSQLSPLQHLSLLLDCWELQRWQLNGLSVLDVLEQQWEAGGQLTAAAAEDAAPIEQPRKRRREGGSRAHNSAVPVAPLSLATSTTGDWTRQWQSGENSEDGSQRRTAVMDGSSDKQTTRAAPSAAVNSQFPLSRRPVAHRRAEYVAATRYTTTPASRVDQSITVTPFSLTLQSLLGSTQHECVSALQQSNIDHASRTVHYSLFLTEYDCYVPGLTFVFGVARLTRCALVSLHRLEGRSPAATAAFLAKECVHEVGHLFSLHHCTAPCVMAYSTTVEEAQQKDAQLCAACAVKLQWMAHGVIIKPASGKQYQQPVGSVEAVAVPAAARALYR